MSDFLWNFRGNFFLTIGNSPKLAPVSPQLFVNFLGTVLTLSGNPSNYAANYWQFLFAARNYSLTFQSSRFEIGNSRGTAARCLVGRPREFGPWAVLGPLGGKFSTRQRLYQKAPPKYRAGGDAIAFPALAGLAHPRVAQSRPLCGRPSGRVTVWRRH